MIRTFTRRLYLGSRSFSTVINSVPGDRPPVREENVEGRYAGVLFTIASRNQELDAVNTDMTLISQALKQSEKFYNFVINSSNTKAECETVLQTIIPSLSKTTQQFLSTLVDNKRVTDLPRISNRFVEYFKLLNKEEGVTVISARELTADQRKRVQQTLEESYKGTTFTVKYQVDSSILGGLQVYFGNSFMDASLLSRVNLIRGEFEKLSM